MQVAFPIDCKKRFVKWITYLLSTDLKKIATKNFAFINSKIKKKTNKNLWFSSAQKNHKIFIKCLENI